MGELREERDNEVVYSSNRKMGELRDDSERIMKRRLSRIKSRRSFKLRSESLNSLRLRRVFDLFDKNGDGVISVDEIKEALVLLGLEDLDKGDDDDDGELQSMVTSFIKQGHHGLAFEDFVDLHKSLDTTIFYDCDDVLVDEQMESDLTEAFKVFDSDGDGFISATELQQVLFKLGFPEAQQQLHHIQLMISSFDHNRDGQVDFFEFKQMMSHTLLLPS